MKKSIIVLSIFLTLITILISCNKHDEIYNPKNKISKIWFRSDVGDADQIFNYKEKELASITLKDGRYYSFTYNKDHTINKIEYLNEYNLLESIQLSHTDKFLTKLEYTIDGEIREEITFIRDINHNISTITSNYDRAFFNSLDTIMRSGFYNNFIGTNPALLETLAKIETKDLILNTLSVVTYDIELHNITSIATTNPDYNLISVTDYTYDEGNNPYFGLPYAYIELLGYSKNNKITERCVTKVYGNVFSDILTTYEYIYNDNLYPRRIITRASDNNNIPINTYILFVKE